MLYFLRMQTKQIQQRKLNHIEQAFALANEHYPFCVVTVLHLRNIPDEMRWQQAIVSLQMRHVLLRSVIKKYNGQYWFFKQDRYASIALKTHDRFNKESWRPVAEELLNTQFEEGAPLLKVAMVTNAIDDSGEIICCFHHAIVDGHYARLLLHEILSLAAGLTLPLSRHNLLQEAHLPGQKRGESIRCFFARQMRAEWHYWKKGNRAKIASSNNNASLSLNFTPEQSKNLMDEAARQGISLNSLFLAAISIAVLQNKYAGKAKPIFRAISFADLRANLSKQENSDYTGCLVTMLRTDIQAKERFSLPDLAGALQRSLTRSGLRREPLHMFRTSKTLMRMAIKLKVQRLGISALSFLGNLLLDERYGNLSLAHVTAFVTNNQLGPQLSAFGKILHGKISLDFTYLTAETTHAEAKQMVDYVRNQLDSFAGKAYI